MPNRNLLKIQWMRDPDSRDDRGLADLSRPSGAV